MTDPAPATAATVEVTVYVVERGCYSDRYLAGVYGSLAEAKEGLPHDPPGTGEVEWNKDQSWWARTDPDGWTETGRSEGPTRWSNGLDWDDAVTIEPHKVTIEVPAMSDSRTRATAAGPAADHHPSIDALCCHGLCRRKQPPMVMRSGLTGTWYVVTRYKHLGDGRFEAIEKHMLARESADQLEALTNA